MDQLHIPSQRLRELKEENETLKCENAELRAQLNRTMKQLFVVQEQLAMSEKVAMATQRRELQQEGIYENLLTDNIYEKLQTECEEEHVYTKLRPGSVCLYFCRLLLSCRKRFDDSKLVGLFRN